MSDEKFEAWAVVELFGHSTCAGKLTEQTIGGETFVRIDVPHPEGEYTRLFGKGAIYAINLSDEATARRYAARSTPPLKPYTPPAMSTIAALPAGQDIDDDGDL
jgi:hypothetical protein